MTARTITIMSLLVCALAIPVTASAERVDKGYPALATGIGSLASEPPSQGGYVQNRRPITGGAAAHQTTGIGSPASEPTVGHAAGPGHTVNHPTPNDYRGGPSMIPVAPSAAAGEDGFDLGSAAVGAGAAMALVALGGAALLTVRRRSAGSRSAATMS